MEIKDFEKYRIITPLSPELSDIETKKIYNEIANSTKTKIGIDMTFVQDCTIDFLSNICKNGKLSLFNISSDIFALMLNMNLDKYVKLYATEFDFIENKHQLINRKFKVI